VAQCEEAKVTPISQEDYNEEDYPEDYNLSWQSNLGVDPGSDDIL
jgi:hypothetical protein